MEKLLTVQNLLFIITLGSLLIAIYDKIFKPQSALQAQQNLDQTETNAEINRLRDYAKWNQSANENKFAEINQRMEKANEVQQKEMHTIDGKINSLQKALDTLARDMVEVRTMLKMLNEKVEKKF